MIDPRTLKVGQRVEIMITGYVGPARAKVAADGTPTRWAVLQVDGWPDNLTLREEDYVVLEVLP